MSRKKRRDHVRGGFAWPLAAFGLVLLIAAAVLFARNASTSAATGSVASDGGSIAVDQQKIDYGYVKFGNTESFKIKVTNTGTGALQFTDAPYIEVREGC